MSDPLSPVRLPAISAVQATRLNRGSNGLNRSTHENNSYSRPDPGRQQLMSERALLQLAWVGLVALREGYTCPPPALNPEAAAVPEPAPEMVRAYIMPDPPSGGRALSAYRRSASLAEPRPLRLVDTHA